MNEPNSERSHTSNLEELNKTLQRIGEESIRLEEEWGKSRPLLCYALHPDVLSNDDYEKLRNLIVNKSFYDLLNKFNPHRNCERQRGIIVFLIRKFFEDSDGKNCWKVWGEESPEWKGKVQECFSTYDEQNLIGENDDNDLAGESSSLREYLKFHCWALKCDEENERKGVSSTRIKVNTDYHSKLEGSCESEKMKRILEADSRDECVGESEDPPKYVKCLLSDFWREYLLSLCCIAALENDKDVEGLIDDNEWKWLKPLVGRAPSKEPTGSWRWHLIDSHGYYYLESPVLEEVEEEKNVRYRQSSEDPSDDKREVQREEIDPTKETEILKGEKTFGRIDKLTPIRGFILFQQIISRKKEPGNVELERNSSYRKGFYLLHRNPDAPQINVRDNQGRSREATVKSGACKVGGFGNGWYCTEYKLPDWSKEVEGGLPKGLSLYVTVGDETWHLLDLRVKFEYDVCGELCRSKKIHIVKLEGDDRAIRINTMNREVEVKVIEKKDHIPCEPPTKESIKQGDKQPTEECHVIRLRDRHSYGYLELELYSTIDKGKLAEIRIYVLPNQMGEAFGACKGDDWYKNIYRRGVEEWEEKDPNGKLGKIELPLSETKWWWKRKRDGEPIEEKKYITSSLLEHEEDELYFRSPYMCDLRFECEGEQFTLESAQSRRCRELGFILDNIGEKVKGRHDIRLLIVEKAGTEERPIPVLEAQYLPRKPEVDLDRWRIIGRNLDAATGLLVIEHEKFYYSSEQEKAHYRIERELSELQYDQEERIMPPLPNDWSDGCIVCYFEKGRENAPWGWVLKNPEKRDTLFERIENIPGALSNIAKHWVQWTRNHPLYDYFQDFIKDYWEQLSKEKVHEQGFIDDCQSLIELLDDLGKLKRDGRPVTYLKNGCYRPYICQRGGVSDEGHLCLYQAESGGCHPYRPKGKYYPQDICLLSINKDCKAQLEKRQCIEFPEEKMEEIVKGWFLTGRQEKENESIDSYHTRTETTFKEICKLFMKETAVERIVNLINEGEDDMLRGRMYAVFFVAACVILYWEKGKDFSHLGEKLPQTFMEIFKRESEALKIRVCSFMHHLKNLA